VEPTIAGRSPLPGWLANISTIPGPAGIWAPGIEGQTLADASEFFFTKTFTLPGTPAGGSLSLAVDDLAEVRVNGVSAGTRGSVTDSVVAAAARNTLVTIDIGPFLVAGQHRLVRRAPNGPPSCAGCEPGPCTYAENPAGVVFGGIVSFAPPNLPPDCHAAFAVPDSAWPPNHKFIGVDVQGVTDPDGDAVTITY